MNESIGHIKDVVEARYGYKALHLSSEAVVVGAGGEDGKVLWEGIVETFDLRGWRRCYAWNHEGEDGTACVTVLEMPPVIGPHTAVQAALAARKRKSVWTGQ